MVLPGAQFPCFDWLSIPKVCGIEVQLPRIWISSMKPPLMSIFSTDFEWQTWWPPEGPNIHPPCPSLCGKYTTPKYPCSLVPYHTIQTTYMKKHIVSLGNSRIDPCICYPPSCWPFYLENILDFTLVSSDLFYARHIQDNRGIDTAMPCKLVCKSAAHKKATCGLSTWHHNSGATLHFWEDIFLWCMKYSKHCSCWVIWHKYG